MARLHIVERELLQAALARIGGGGLAAGAAASP
jgi:hypothetical protein